MKGERQHSHGEDGVPCSAEAELLGVRGQQEEESTGKGLHEVWRGLLSFFSLGPTRLLQTMFAFAV